MACMITQAPNLSDLGFCTPETTPLLNLQACMMQRKQRPASQRTVNALEERIMDEVDFIEEQLDLGAISADEKMRLRVAFGDNVAQRYLALRGIVGDAMQDAVLERHANREADRMARAIIAFASGQGSH